MTTSAVAKCPLCVDGVCGKNRVWCSDNARMAVTQQQHVSVEDARDAERYRWIRDKQATIIYKRVETGHWQPLVDTYATSTRCESLDAAIDDAINQGQSND